MVGWRHERPPDGLSLGSRILRVGAAIVGGYVAAWIVARLAVVLLYPGLSGQLELATNADARAMIRVVWLLAWAGSTVALAHAALSWRRSS